MAKYSRRLSIIISAAIFWFIVMIWLIFNLKLLDAITRNRTFIFILAFVCIVHIGFYYRIAKRVPYFAIGLGVLAGGLALCTVFIIANFVFNLDNAWLDRIFDLSQALLILAPLILFWQTVKKLREKKKETSRTDR